MYVVLHVFDQLGGRFESPTVVSRHHTLAAAERAAKRRNRREPCNGGGRCFWVTSGGMP